MPRTKQDSAKKNWCFTVFNWTEEQYKKIIEAENVEYMIVGKETCPETGTKHLQGYVQLKTRKRLTGVKEIDAGAHWEAARGTPEDNKKYCSKDGDFEEVGTMTEVGKKKCDMVDACHMKVSGASVSEIIEKHGAGYIMNKRKIDEAADEVIIENNKKKIKQEMIQNGLRGWQEDVVNKLKEQGDRKILFVVDTEGNMGKTYLSKYLVTMENAVRFENGKSADIKHGYNGEKIVCFDLTRSAMEHINYEAIEAIKNGIMYTTKYESKMKVYDPPAMVIFMNNGPDMSKLSLDRYDIMNLNML